MTRYTTKVLAGVTVAALAAAGVGAMINYHRGQRPSPQQRAHLDELDARLSLAEAAGSATPPGGVARTLDSLQRNQGISVGRLRGWITGVRQGTLSPEQATVAESDFAALEGRADQGGV